jgi:hypothetical protein
MSKEHMPGSENDFSPEDRQRMEEGVWYAKAREKVESFLSDIDPDLEVDIESSVVTPDDPGKSEYRTDALIFTHRTKPDLRWTMEIEESDDYIDNQLEGVIRKIYRQNIGV